MRYIYITGKAYNMICDCCKKKMIEGRIPALGLWWMPKSDETQLWAKDTVNTKYRLDSMETMQVKYKTAYYCSECNRIVVDCNSDID
jgi:hypothetical protein